MADPIKILYLYTKYRLQKDVYDPEAENTLNQLKAEENEVHDLNSFIDEIKYRWKGNPWLGGYNKTLEGTFSGPSIYETLESLTKPSTSRTLYPEQGTYPSKDKFIELEPKLMGPEHRLKPTKKQQGPAKKQQGGQLNMNEQELQQAFLQFLAQKTGAKTREELAAVIKQLGNEGIKQAYAEFMQLMQQQQVQAAKFGAKLNYIRSLRGQCPEGYEVAYYQKGGHMCKVCQKAKQEEVNTSNDPILQFKCGRKMNKKKKCEEGGELNSTRNPNLFNKMALAKCGSKVKKKKCEDGGPVNMDKCGAKVKKKKCQIGGTLLKAQDVYSEYKNSGYYASIPSFMKK